MRSAFLQRRINLKLIYAENGVAYLRSELITSPHGFATRIGGVSALPHTKGLNLAFGRGDEKETVLENLSLFASAVGIDARSVCSVPQIHSKNVVTVDKSHSGYGYFKDSFFECDGYVTKDTGVSLGVKTADCIPILLEGTDENGKVIAVGALHAGWRGTAANIVREGLLKLEELGVKAENVRAAIGSGICQRCFQVRRDCRDTILELLGEGYEKFIRADTDGEHFYVDLAKINRELLLDGGVAAENINVSELCTACHPELFYSHRYSNGVRGTMLSVIALEKVN